MDGRVERDLQVSCSVHETVQGAGRVLQGRRPTRRPPPSAAPSRPRGAPGPLPATLQRPVGSAPLSPPLRGPAEPRAACFMGPAKTVSPGARLKRQSQRGRKGRFMIHSLLSPVPTTNRKLRVDFYGRDINPWQAGSPIDKLSGVSRPRQPWVQGPFIVNGCRLLPLHEAGVRPLAELPNVTVFITRLRRACPSMSPHSQILYKAPGRREG